VATLKILNAQNVRALLPMDRCIDLMRKAMLLVAENGTLQPIRTSLQHPHRAGLLSMMPGYTAEPERLGIKVVSVYPGNFGTELGSHQGVVLLFDAERGRPVAILDGREITAIRTAAATAVATDMLARKSASVLAILGYGEQARTHLEALPLVRTFRRVIIWGRDRQKAQAFCEETRARLSCRVEVAESAGQAVADADVICTTTAASEPVLSGAWLRAGQHLNVVGSSIPSTSEIDVETIVRSRVFVDFKDSALQLAGDFRRAKAAGAVDDSHIRGSIGDILGKRVVGRKTDEDITLFKSLGMICEDLVAADFILNESVRREIGTAVEWS
jgi:ornithine cyclodeaminase/alanine dehydrogenase-like protein (mu-crystallin family)